MVDNYDEAIGAYTKEYILKLELDAQMVKTKL